MNKFEGLSFTIDFDRERFTVNDVMTLMYLIPRKAQGVTGIRRRDWILYVYVQQQDLNTLESIKQVVVDYKPPI